MPSPRPSTLLLQECYSSEDERFLEELRGVEESGALAAQAAKWIADPRPWARQQMLRYLGEPFNRNGHAVVVKRLFKHAEKSGDDELMGAFLAAFDCLVRRLRRKRHEWDQASRSVYEIEELRTPRNYFRGPQPVWDPRTRKTEVKPSPSRPSDRLFTYRTRYYLQRRAWRYFRLMGFRDGARYLTAIAAALGRYQDSDFQKGENYLDSWGFMHACFGTHAAVEFSSFRAGFRKGTGLADLAPAPAFPAHWFSQAGMTAAVSLATKAGSRAVRTWAVKLLALPSMLLAASPEYADLRPILMSDDEEVQIAAVKILENCPDVSRWTIAQWLELTEAPGAAVVNSVSLLIARHVHPDRLDPAQCMALACARPVPVARVGFDFLKAKSLSPDNTRALLPRAAGARCAAIAADLTTWSLDRLAAVEGDYDREPLTAFLDSLTAETRLAAWDWLAARRDTPAWADPVLWSRLAETPFDDLRLRLVDALARRAARPASHAADLTPVWTSVLLAVHRGSRGKPKAVSQIAAAIRADHARAGTLLPVLAVAVRSLRAPEQRAGLAAVASLLTDDALTAAVQQHLPEARWL